MARISIIGTGYVGLTTGACFSHLGHDVVCADVDADKVARLQAGEIPIIEKGLDRLVDEGVRSGKLRFVVGGAEAAKDAEFHYLCVPTPQGHDGAADLSYLEQAARDIRDVLPNKSVVVNKSTVPVGSTTVVSNVLGRSDVSVVSNPEFLREGTAVDDFLEPDRVVIGARDPEAAIRVAGLYSRIAAPVMVTDPISAETIKYASNAFLASKLSFVNAIATLCEAVGADVNDVVLGMGYDPRIGREFLRPGPGWGGSCFPKDTRALANIAREAGYDFRFLDEVLRVNEDQFDRTAQKVLDAIDPSLVDRHVAALGLTFKAGTDDLRDSPAIEILTRVREAGIRVKCYDPAVADNSTVARMYPDLDIEVVADPYAAAEGASVLTVLTEWDEFTGLDFDKLAEVMIGKSIVDARNLLEPSVPRRRGFEYRGVGR
ncbi:MAG: UDP-glucose dehydrogenase family protein [Acidimicrobiales bacterium]